ncbi:MAG: biotin/lipoyl-binding protein, partial [Chitinophagaceae bacterium]|nr:biotin/lipoyl-binding protein [Chitinophagaceae bacterium]
MQKISRLSLLLAVILFSSSCGSSSKKEREGGLNDKKTELQKLQNDRTKLDDKIKVLQTDITKLDTGAAKQDKAKLVSVIPVGAQNFQHYIDLQGKVDAENISYISPRGMGGQVRAIYVKQGDNVRKGQLLLKLDDAIARQNVVAIRQNLGGVKTQLALAQSVYSRQKNLWDQHIGTEVQLLQAKTNVESLQNQLRSISENV